MNDVVVQDFLAHHGIKGMHWGVRRDLKSDNKKRQQEDNTGKNFHLTKKQAGIGASVILGLAASAVIFHNRGTIKLAALRPIAKSGSRESTLYYGKERFEKDILPAVGHLKESEFPKGKIFTRFSSVAEQNVRQGAYANHLPKDVLEFKTDWGLDKNRHEIKIQALKNVKVPSLSTRIKAMGELVDKPINGVTKNDETLRSHLVGLQDTSKAKLWVRTAPAEDIGKAVYGSVLGERWDNGIGKALADNLVKKGYGAMSDDTDNSNGLSTSATVLLDSTLFKVVSNNKLSSSEIDNAYVMLKTIFKS